MSYQVWEQLYKDGHEQTYPWDSVVSFIFRNIPKNICKSEIKILEIGFGTGSNLWFAAREGFKVYGIEQSPSAVEVARKRLEMDKLTGELRTGDFANLPYEDCVFDLALDRAALTCVGCLAQKKAIDEVKRCLKPGGKFLCNCYADSHSSYRSGTQGPDGVKQNISEGTLVDVGQIFFSSRKDIDSLFLEGWNLCQVERREWTDMLNAKSNVHAEWLIVAQKIE